KNKMLNRIRSAKVEEQGPREEPCRWPGAYYWLAINGSSVALARIPVSVEVLARSRVSPTPQQLIGFPTHEEAAAAQQLLLTAPIEAVRARMGEWAGRADVAVIVPHHPEPPTTGVTLWSFWPAA